MRARSAIRRTDQPDLRLDKKNRQSGVELLRLIAMFMICMSHCAQTMEGYVDFQAPTSNWQFLLMRIMRFGGTIGNILFVVCSSYFLVGKRKGRPEKVINLLLDSQIISVGFFSCFCLIAVIRGSQFHFSVEATLSNIFPDLYESVWFVPCYAVFYLIHPALNLCIENLTRKQHLAVCLTITVLYGLGGIINAKPVFSSLIGFVCVFLIVAYIKNYHIDFIHDKKRNLKVFLICFCTFIGIVVAKNYLSFSSEVFLSYPNIDGIISIVFLPMLICLFHLFVNMEFSNRLINYLASCSLFFYCIHENKIIREEIRPQFYSFLIGRFGESHLLFYVCLLIFVLLIGGFIAAVIYKETIHRVSAKISEKIAVNIGKVYDRFLEKTEI